MLKYMPKNGHFRIHLSWIIALVLTLSASAGHAQQDEQKRFSSPQEACSALTAAATTNDVTAMLAILGPKSKDLISSGDAIADSNARRRFVASVNDGVTVKSLDDNTVLVVTGKDACTFPIPIIKSGDKWVFATDEGRQEILNRRIGKNELSTIETALQYVDVQREYAKKDRDGSGILHYAQHFSSHEGKKDGLYWSAKPGEESSPLGPLFESASKEGYPVGKHEGKHRPYHGYYFRILQSQGSHAEGGQLDYVVNGRMTAGFALLAYPAEYGVSGIMTFIVNQKGIVYEKNLGINTEKLAGDLRTYDPDDTWQKVTTTSPAH